MYVNACENAALRGAANFVSPHPVTNAEFTRVIAAQVRRPAIVPAPSALLRLGLGGMSEMLLNSQRLDPEAFRLVGFDWEVPSVDLAIRRAFV
jgi:NAD dependent epimerase/dehydratase family enzyme